MNTPMDDENLARRAFTAAFRSGATGEPPVLPDVESLVNRGRRASRKRHGVYAAGTTAMAGVVTAGVVTAPTLLGIGGASPSGISAGAGGTTAAPTGSKSSEPPDAKALSGVACATPADIDWLKVVSPALPTGVTATAEHFATCVQTADGSRSTQAWFTLSTGAAVQVSVSTGPAINAKLDAAGGKPITPNSSTDPAEAALLASKLAHAGLASAPDNASSSQSLDAAAIASLDAQKHALASAAATTSDSSSPDVVVKESGSCSTIAPDETLCVSHLTKDSTPVVDVAITRTGASPLVLDAVASNGKNASPAAPGALPSDATMVAIAKAVAAHF